MPASAFVARVNRHADERPDALAYRVVGGASLTYRELSDRAAALGETLATRLPPQSVVLLSCPSQLEYPIAFLAILAAGCTVFPISPKAADNDLLRASVDSRAAGVIGDDRATSLLRESLPWVQPIVPGGMGVPPMSSSPKKEHGRDAHATVGDLLLQSSGTTGLPKIVRRSGASLDAVARVMAESIGFRPDDRVLMTVPLTHSYGLEHGLLAPLWAGSCVHVVRGLDWQAILPELAGGITIFPGVPSTFEMLANIPGDTPAMPPPRLAYSAGAPLPRSVFDAFTNRFKIRITQLYGATEIGSVAYNAPDEPFDAASVGRAMQGVSIRILEVDQNIPLPPGEEGQIAIRAASMFNGYINAPADLIDGYFPTGDLGRVDADGRLFVTGRIKLLIDVGGMKVNPLEVESILQQHPSVAACAVVPVKQSETVNRLKAVIAPRDPTAPPPVDELRQLARAHLSAYKIPRLFEFRDVLPRSASGKILRHLLETT
jgi:acyl-CoA synthetase (AMP-forming)/AMP-acid ligase II